MQEQWIHKIAELVSDVPRLMIKWYKELRREIKVQIEEIV